MNKKGKDGVGGVVGKTIQDHQTRDEIIINWIDIENNSREKMQLKQ